MDSKDQEQQHPLLEPVSQSQTQNMQPNKPTKTPTQKAIRKTFKGTTHLSNLLPTGSVFTFQVLSPVFTFQGHCKTIISHTLTLALLGFCSLSCFLLCFTDSFRDQSGKVRYGIATYRGIWVIDGSAPPENAEDYKIRFVDFFHGLLSVMVFGVLAMFDQNMVNCFNPLPSEEFKEVLMTVRVVVGVVSSILFLVFPTRRHGIGFPVSRR